MVTYYIAVSLLERNLVKLQILKAIHNPCATPYFFVELERNLVKLQILKAIHNYLYDIMLQSGVGT